MGELRKIAKRKEIINILRIGEDRYILGTNGWTNYKKAQEHLKTYLNTKKSHNKQGT